MKGEFLATVGDQTPVILCEKHAKAFEAMMIAHDVTHTIIELDDADKTEHCHSCDLVLAKEYADYLRAEAEALTTPKIILPGEF